MTLGSPDERVNAVVSRRNYGDKQVLSEKVGANLRHFHEPRALRTVATTISKEIPWTREGATRTDLFLIPAREFISDFQSSTL